MGGSFALALKRAGAGQARGGLQQVTLHHRACRQLGVIDVEAPSALLAVSGADIVLIAVPFPRPKHLQAIKHLVSPHTLIMDVGSTKRDVVDAAAVPCASISARSCRRTRLPARKSPVVEHADPDLYSGKQVILTPIETHPDHPAAASR